MIHLSPGMHAPLPAGQEMMATGLRLQVRFASSEQVLEHEPVAPPQSKSAPQKRPVGVKQVPGNIPTVVSGKPAAWMPNWPPLTVFPRTTGRTDRTAAAIP